MNAMRRPRATWVRDLPPRGAGRGRTQQTFPVPRLRSAAIALIALGALTVPHSAAAMVPRPDPPAIRFPLMDVGVAILQLTEEYAEAPLTQKRLLHNDMVLVVNTRCSSI